MAAIDRTCWATTAQWPWPACDTRMRNVWDNLWQTKGKTGLFLEVKRPDENFRFRGKTANIWHQFYYLTSVTKTLQRQQMTKEKALEVYHRTSSWWTALTWEVHATASPASSPGNVLGGHDWSSHDAKLPRVGQPRRRFLDHGRGRPFITEAKVKFTWRWITQINDYDLRK